MSNALKELCQLADRRKAERSPNFPANYIPRSKYSDRDANGLTRCIVDYLNYSGHFATRLQSTGQYRADLKRFIGSQQRAGLPDVFAVVEGRAVFAEVKIGRDSLSQTQKDTISDLENAGAACHVSKDFQGFYDWFTAHFLTPPFA